jgi:hypothetical protein
VPVAAVAAMAAAAPSVTMAPETRVPTHAESSAAQNFAPS